MQLFTMHSWWVYFRAIIDSGYKEDKYGPIIYYHFSVMIETL